MAKIADEKDPSSIYSPPLVRFSSMLPLERDALKGGKFFHKYEIYPEPYYSHPAPAKDGMVLFMVSTYDIRGKNGKRPVEKGIVLESMKGLNLSLEHLPLNPRRLAVKILCADASGVKEVPIDENVLVKISRADAERILARDLIKSSVYIVGGIPGNELIRRATPEDAKPLAQPADAIFLFGRCGLCTDTKFAELSIAH